MSIDVSDAEEGVMLDEDEGGADVAVVEVAVLEVGKTDSVLDGTPDVVFAEDSESDVLVKI